MLPKFIAGEAARQHWKKPIVQSEMHIMHFHQLTGYVFVKRANVVLDVDQKRNTCIKAEPIEGQGELWKKKNEHIYTMVRNNHVVKIGGTRVGMKERFGSYLCGHYVQQRQKSNGENYPGKMSVTNAYLYHTIEDDLLNGGKWEIYSHELPPPFVEMNVYGKMIKIEAQTFHAYESQCIEMYKDEIGRIPCLCANSDPTYKQKNTKGAPACITLF